MVADVGLYRFPQFGECSFFFFSFFLKELLTSKGYVSGNRVWRRDGREALSRELLFSEDSKRFTRMTAREQTIES